MTEMFEKRFNKIIPLHLQDKTWVRIFSLADNPYIGKPLRYSFIRELKLEQFRIYFIILENEVTILMINVSDKKEQQEIINFIVNNRKYFVELVKNLKTLR